MGKTLYLECYSGISGDMTVAALLDLEADRSVLDRVLKSLNVSGFETKISRVVKSGIDACDFDVVLDKEHENHDHDMEYLHRHHHEGHERNHAHGTGTAQDHHHHEHRGIKEITYIIEHSAMTENAKKMALRIFEILAEAESKAHNVPVDQVHFHEVGAVDSIVDIVSVAVCLDDLDVTEVIVPVLCEGRGTVRCQHGILPIPVPAVVNIVSANHLHLKMTEVEGELVTPTGAAIVAAVKTKDKLPETFEIQKIGIGAGKRQYECPGILRAMIISQSAETDEAKAQTVAVQDKALNTAWYVFGTKSELKDQKILQRGDVLKNNEFNKDYFTEIDIRKDKEVKLYSKRAELLTTHPEGSYEFVKDDKGQLTLKITNPNTFWSVSRYLVIQVR